MALFIKDSSFPRGKRQTADGSGSGAGASVGTAAKSAKTEQTADALFKVSVLNILDERMDEYESCSGHCVLCACICSGCMQYGE